MGTDLVQEPIKLLAAAETDSHRDLADALFHARHFDSSNQERCRVYLGCSKHYWNRPEPKYKFGEWRKGSQARFAHQGLRQ